MNREDEFVGRIARRWRGGRLPAGAIGIGDDAAVLPVAGRAPLVISTDLFVESVHFDLRWSPPALVGHKALAAAASDIAAMGARCLGCLVSLAIPARLPRRVTGTILSGLSDEARAIGIPLLGGDLSRSAEKLLIDVVVVGRSAGRRPVLRSGARPGDRLYVTGPLGGAATGLSRLRAGCRPVPLLRARPRGERARERHAMESLAVLAHLSPRPPLAAGAAFGRSGLPTAMMDLSDGLATDLRRLAAASGVGARVEEASLPRHPSAEHFLGAAGALRAALGGGEDYELLLAAPAGAEEKLRRIAEGAGSGLHRIGRVTRASSGLALLGPRGGRRTLPRLGHDHLAPAPRSRPRR